MLTSGLPDVIISTLFYLLLRASCNHFYAVTVVSRAPQAANVLLFLFF